MSRSSQTLTAVIGGVTLSLIGIGAAAAPLPVDDALLGYDVNGEFVIIAEDGTTDFTGISTGLTAGDAAFDPSTELVFALNNSVNPCELITIDLTTGVVDTVGVVDDAGTTFTNCFGVAIAPTGDLWLAVGGTTLLRVNKLNATVLETQTVSGLLNPQIDALAISPIDGAFYATDPGQGLYAIDSGWSATQVPFPGLVYSVDFDRTGQLWFIGAGSLCPTALSSADVPDVAGTETFRGDLLDASAVCVDAFTLFIARQASTPAQSPTLAATGLLLPTAPLGLAALVIALGLIATWLVRPVKRSEQTSE